MRSFKHWTPRYLGDRCLNLIWEFMHPKSPWLTPSAISFVESWLRPSDTGLECGSGRSTIWFASRLARLVSIEHAPEWAETVREALRAKGLDGRVDYRFHPDGISGDPESSYVKAVRNLPDDSIDLALIDGMARDHCIFAAVPKLRRAGLMVVDNVNWFVPREPPSHSPSSRTAAQGYATPGWRAFGELVANWRVIWTTNGVTDTAIWIKPAK